MAAPNAPAEGDGAESEAREPEEEETGTPIVEMPDLFTGNYEDKLQISELMPKNKAAVLDPTGGFADWAELENVSGETLSLQGWGLSDAEGRLGWTFPETELAPGERNSRSPPTASTPPSSS